jgi:hypothetical protein
MLETWELFFDKKNSLLQKSQINKNDLFVNPIDINDGNIPNGNSIYLYVSQNLHSIQMPSYLKYLDMAEEKITFTFFGNIKNLDGLHKYVKKNYLNAATIIYKKGEKSYLLACKNKTCSLPIESLKDLEEHLKKNSIN